MSEPIRVCFVCLGNICRSPTAEAVMTTLIAEAGFTARIEVDSAGTSGWHIGDPPDERSQAEAIRRGIRMTSRGRQVHAGDFHHFDLLVAMDRRNEQDLLDLAPTPELRSKVRLLRSYDPALRETEGADLDVPDPYYGGVRGFADVFDIVDAGCRGLLDELLDSQADDGHADNGQGSTTSGLSPVEPPRP